MPQDPDTTEPYESPDSPRDSAKDAAILREIRENYRRWSEFWRDARDERKIDLRYLCGNPWDDKDRRARADAGRPCINHDELNQYVNQCVNSARQNKRGIKIEPEGNGANDKTAELREDLARTIEYRSKAQAIYLQAYQDEVEGGYGFARVSRRYINDDTDDQEIVIRPIPNPDAVLYDPDCKEPDWRDARGCFVLDPLPRADFKALYPGAQLTDFADEDGSIRRDWLHDDTVLTAEYWKVVTERVKGKTGRMVEKKSLVQYITNGVEILEENEQPGVEVPIVPFVGLQRFVDEGNGPRRKLFSLVRFARDPQMSLAFLCSQEAEEAGLTPKSPYLGYVGQFETDAEAWASLTKIPRAFVQVDPITDAAGGAVLPLPQRVQFTPNFQQYELAKDSCRRAIQAAMGISPLPTAAQRQNEKSGIALQKIQAAQEVGSFHFVDGYERAIERIGRIVNCWMKVTYDTVRDMSLRTADDSRRQVTLNGEADQDGNVNVIGDEDHAVTIATGPSAESQREAASDFLDLLIGNLEQLPAAPPQKAKLLALSIQMKQLGPKGDEMAEIISPTEQQQLPPQAQQALSGMQQQLQQLNAYAKGLEAKNQQLEFEKKASIVNNEYKLQLEKMKEESADFRAEVETKAQNASERLAFLEDMWKQFHDQAHDAGLQAQDQVHAQNLADQQAKQQQTLAAQQQEQPETAGAAQ